MWCSGRRYPGKESVLVVGTIARGSLPHAEISSAYLYFGILIELQQEFLTLGFNSGVSIDLTEQSTVLPA